MNEPEGFDPTEPNIARVWDYLIGGKNHYPADRAEANRLLAIEPRLGMLARANRGFLRRAVYWLALDCGIRQFLDLGSGLPAAGTVHEVAQAAAPSCRVAYVDNDPVAAVHAAALLAHGNQQVGALRADLTDPAAVLASPEVAGLLDLTRPAAAIFGMVLHFFDADQAGKIIAGYTAELAPGSYVVISCGSGDEATGGRLAREYQPGQVRNHSRDEILGFLDGLELIDPPGLADAWSWAPDVPCLPPSQHGAHVLAAVARTPLHPTELPGIGAAPVHTRAHCDGKCVSRIVLFNRPIQGAYPSEGMRTWLTTLAISTGWCRGRTRRWPVPGR